MDLPPNAGSIPDGIEISDQSVGTFKDGNMLFRGIVTNVRDVRIQGYIVVYTEILDNEGES